MAGKAAPQPEQDSATKADQMIVRWHTAESVLVDSQFPANPTLRGRLTDAGYERVAEFLKADGIYKNLKSIFAGKGTGQRARAMDFQVAVEERLTIFERIAARNPELEVSSRLQGDYNRAYRILVAEVFSHLTREGQDTRGPSILKLNEITPVALKELRIKGDAPAATIEVAIEPPKESQVAVTRPRAMTEDEALEYLTGNVNSFAGQATLAVQIEAIRADPPSVDITNLIDHWIPSGGHFDRQLKDAKAIVDGCKRLRSGETMGFQAEVELARTIHQVRNNPLHGLAIDDPYLQLELEGLVTETEAKRLVTILAAHDQAEAFTLRLASKFEKTAEIDGPAFVRLSASVNQLLRSGSSEEQLEGPLRHVLQGGGRGAVEHVENVAQLTSLGIKPVEFLTVSKAGRAVVAAAAAGRFDEPGVDIASNAAHVLSEMRVRLAILRKVSPEMGTMMVEAMNVLPPTEPAVREAIQLGLVALGPRLPASKLNVKEFESIVSDLAAFSAAGGAIDKFIRIIESPNGKTPTAEMLEFLRDMATLHRNRVTGIGRLFDSAFVVWRRERSGDSTQDLRGFLIEARSAVLLREHGFSIRSVTSREVGSGYEFDILGQAPDGTNCGIEVKRQLSTISLKDGVRVFRDVHGSQLGRFCTGCLDLERKPILAIFDYSPSKDADGEAVRAILEQVRTRVGGPRPTLIHVLTGKEIELD